MDHIYDYRKWIKDQDFENKNNIFVLWQFQYVT